MPSFKQLKFIFTARLQSRLSISKHQQWRGLSSYIQIKLILTAQLRNRTSSKKIKLSWKATCQVKHKSNWFPQHGCGAARQFINKSNIFPQHGCRADCKVLDKSNLFWQHRVLDKSNLFSQHGCRADCQVLNINNWGACQVIYKSNLFWQHRFGAARQVLRQSHTSTAQLQSKLSSSKQIKIIHIAQQCSSLPSSKRIPQHGCGAVCRVLNNLSYSSSIALEPHAKFLINQIIHDALLRSSPPSYKQIKNNSPARLQSRLQRQIKLILTAQLQSSCQVLNKLNLFPQHGCRADCQVLNISNGGACQVIYKSYLFWQHSCGTAVKFLENQT